MPNNCACDTQIKHKGTTRTPQAKKAGDLKTYSVEFREL
jgi:hypothetical protein